MPSVQRGLLADGLGTLTAGLLGTVGLNTFSGSIGIATATGITSRRVAFAIAGLFLAMSMLPPVWRLLAAVPLEVAGGVLMFSDRKSGVWGKSGSVRVELGGRRIIKKK